MADKNPYIKSLKQTLILIIETRPFIFYDIS